MSDAGAAAAGALRDRILDFLACHQVMTVATAEPWAAAVFYVNEGYDLYFVSRADSRHCRGLGADPRVAVTIHEDGADWRRIRGIQIEGLLSTVDASALPAVRSLYSARFPFVGASATLAAALARISWYRVRPGRLCFIDNAAGFGHRDCVDLLGRGASE